MSGSREDKSVPTSTREPINPAHPAPASLDTKSDLKADRTVANFKFKRHVEGIDIEPERYLRNMYHLLPGYFKLPEDSDDDSGLTLIETHSYRPIKDPVISLALADFVTHMKASSVKNTFHSLFGGDGKKAILSTNNLWVCHRWYFTFPDGIQLADWQILDIINAFCSSDSLHNSISTGKDEKEKEKIFIKLFTDFESMPEKRKMLESLSRQQYEIDKAIDENKKLAVSMILPQTTGTPKLFKNLSRYTFFPFNFAFTSHVEQAKYDFDYYSNDAKEAYRVGHRVACKTAEEAAKQKDHKLFVRAMLQELFACNYLIKLFFAGHIRTPRKAIYDYITDKKFFPNSHTALIVAGLLAKEMHDEDYKLSLKGREKQAGCAVSHEDGCYHDDFESYLNDVNKSNLRNAIVKGLENIFYVYQFSGKLHYDALKLIPESPESIPNPLFKTDGSLRKEVNNPKCVEYLTHWEPMAVLMERRLQRKRSDNRSLALSDEAQKELREELNEIAITPHKIECRVM